MIRWVIEVSYNNGIKGYLSELKEIDRVSRRYGVEFGTEYGLNFALPFVSKRDAKAIKRMLEGFFSWKYDCIKFKVKRVNWGNVLREKL